MGSFVVLSFDDYSIFCTLRVVFKRKMLLIYILGKRIKSDILIDIYALFQMGEVGLVL